LRAEVLLGAAIPGDVIANAVLDSQNRFYGVAFALYGVLAFLCAARLQDYATVLRCVLWCLFAGGVARLVSILLYGLPSSLVLALLALEIALPPLLLVWLWRTLRALPAR
jgi:hypothetical protein